LGDTVKFGESTPCTTDTSVHRVTAITLAIVNTINAGCSVITTSSQQVDSVVNKAILEQQ